MKHNDINDIQVKITAQNMENLFNVYETDNGEYYYNLLRTVNFPIDINPYIYFEYETEPGDTWPLIAWKFYKNVKLWWLLCALNHIDNPVAQPTASTRIKVLKTSYVREVLTQIGSN